MSEILREIVFDTETTGTEPENGDRVIDIGCVEMINHTPTGKTYHCYINPERDVPADVVKIHGLTYEFLKDKPKFAEIVDEFLAFIGDSILVAHNASFDIDFINYELRRLNLPALKNDRVVDTLALSRKLNPHFANHNLDALCRRYGVDNSNRDLHGALLDARLLAEVYIELLGGKEVDFFKKSNAESSVDASITTHTKVQKEFRPARKFPATADEIAKHQEFINSFENPDVIWKKVD